ncbi:MAG: chromate transporter [Kiritimatiellae bacterium]|nr:chromate transporter [Kiritimatiellia bacterium]
MLRLLADIFLSFFKIGLFTLGGGLAIISLVQQEMVGRGWLTNAQFMDILGIAQMTPGPIGVNSATFVGYRVAEMHGSPWWAAALVSLFATISVTLPSVIGVHFGGGWFERHRESQWVKRVFATLRPLVAGFVTAAGAMLTLECFGAADVHSLGGLPFSPAACVVFSATLAITLTRRFSPLWGLALGAVMGILV